MARHLLFIIIAVFVLGAAFFAVQANSPFDIEFPIAELGNCADEGECRVFCDDFANKDACVDFARKHGLVEEREAERAKKLPPVGPGGCNSEESCRAYCEDSANIDECTAFGEEHGILEEEEIQRAREFKEEPGPGGCLGPEECRSYCEDPAHQEACIDFAVEKGFMSSTEAERAKKFAGKTGPGGCRGEECRDYCNDPAHIDECFAFAEREGFVSPEDAARIKKAGFTTGPGGCKGEECRTYCEDPGHQIECIDFAVREGFMSPTEAERAKKFAGKTGPGGCRGEECRNYCNDSAHQQECFDFAISEGLLPPEEIERARKFMRIAQEGGPGGCQGREQCEAFCNDSANGEACFEFAKKQGLLPPGAEKEFEVGLKLRKKMQESGGPGGCRTEQECQAYCSDSSHGEECVAFGAAHGGLSEDEVRRMLKEFTEGRQGGPGDFRPPEDFRRFEEEARRRFEEFRQLEHQFRGGPDGFPDGFGPPGGFPGAPGEFPGAPGAFPGGPGGFAGPGGCTSPAECIQYCTAHKDECFGTGGGPGFGPGGPPQLRPDLLRQAPAAPRDGGFPAPADVQSGPPAFTPGSSGSINISINKNSSEGFDIIIRASGGIEDFAIEPAAGQIRGTSVYGGNAGCQPEFRAERLGLSSSHFPLKVRVVDCGGNKVEREIPAVAAGFQSELPREPDISAVGPGSAPAGETGFVPPEALLPAPTTVSGVCLVWSGRTTFPTFFDSDTGPGYVKIAKPGINDILKLRQACTRVDYDELLRRYCANNSDPAQEQVATFNSQGGHQSNGGGPFGNDYRSCSAGSAPSEGFFATIIGAFAKLLKSE